MRKDIWWRAKELACAAPLPGETTAPNPSATTNLQGFLFLTAPQSDCRTNLQGFFLFLKAPSLSATANLQGILFLTASLSARPICKVFFCF